MTIKSTKRSALTRRASRYTRKRRRLQAEALEPRHLLAAFLVTNTNDTGPGSLRMAIEHANTSGGADSITFDSSLSGARIDLLSGEIVISDSLIIDATGLGSSVTIDAQGNSRILSFDNSAGDLTLSGLTFTGGNASGNGVISGRLAFLTLNNSAVIANTGTGVTGRSITLNSSTVSGNTGGGVSGTLIFVNDSFVNNNTSGGIYAADSLTLDNSTVTDNISRSNGGGIRTNSGTIALNNSIVSDNTVKFPSSSGGGVYSRSGSVTLNGSTMSGNRVTSVVASGGGIATQSGAITVNNSTLDGNTAMGTGQPDIGPSIKGGGISTRSGPVVVNSSTISGNNASGIGSAGGGIYARSATVTINSSTVSGNHAMGSTTPTGSGSNFTSNGGGLFAEFSNSIELRNSTITGNTAEGIWGGVFAYSFNRPVEIENSILAGNTDSSGNADDLYSGTNSMLTVNHSLIGVADHLANVNGNVGNQFGTASNPLAPLLGSLSDNGGPTKTHALLPGSPSINAGSSSELIDQRGAPFLRDDGNGVDIGAYEFHAAAPQVSSIQIDDGTAQRSAVRNITVNFDAPIIFDAGGFDLRDDQNNPVDVTTSVTPGTLTSQVILTFNGVGSDASGSLLDADYTLTVLDTKVRSATGIYLDGNNNGSMGGDAVDSFYRLFGDANGDENTDFLDFSGFFLPAFGTGVGNQDYFAGMDFDGDGNVDFLDFSNGFLPNFGKGR